MDRNGGYRGNQDRGGQRNDLPPSPPPVKIDSFYADGKLLVDLFDETAEKIADSFLVKNTRTAVSKTQLRRLFDEVKRFEQIIDVSPEQFSSQLPYIRMIRSKVTYLTARAIKDNFAAKVVYQNLSAFISDCIKLIKEAKDYHVFVSLFEAVYGFYWEKNHNKD
ncbi:putative crispr-associated protein, Csm2 family [Treponema primitia ZAS-2]|uniref:CRISPR system Cms protein Csm2 n=1 Tax=Treponema primitia (strain ATCC BAA-887 / DSM 12427 / ZAS-2) TaxID=545694 RepID=F5YHB0_TREPZ|nr:type III-A CRISPR-associated protein Csm2 [Treponema primitia]AEF83656.1 putative crispr-associated protein, Csm2 family [Treponema primitia ZAS-2]